MILIGKTANCLLGAYVIAHSAVLKAVDAATAHAPNHVTHE